MAARDQTHRRLSASEHWLQGHGGWISFSRRASGPEFWLADPLRSASTTVRPFSSMRLRADHARLRRDQGDRDTPLGGLEMSTHSQPTDPGRVCQSPEMFESTSLLSARTHPPSADPLVRRAGGFTRDTAPGHEHIRGRHFDGALKCAKKNPSSRPELSRGSAEPSAWRMGGGEVAGRDRGDAGCERKEPRTPFCSRDVRVLRSQLSGTEESGEDLYREHAGREAHQEHGPA